MPSKEHEALVEKVAKAINGPFHPVPEGSLFTLHQLRDVRWQQINGAERKLCLASAQAAISTIFAALQEPTEGMREAGIEAIDDNWERGVMRPAANSSLTCWRVMLAASALGEQSE
ncbi:hypothetical protein BG46_15920 [Brucella anthropi]|uniref:hypothetical protein n=1 Tax=Brucella anthropi TaxID=529 RepID=UPI00044D15A4|nr:hypothetical protein [Brucella anthropi]EXL06244.1 hypothetical protein BG46_15920 [Brucella anthropi]